MSALIASIVSRSCFSKRFLLFNNLKVSQTYSSTAHLTTKKSSECLKAVVGLELHAQINASSKLFSSSPAKYGAAPNTQVSNFDAAMPGTLPVLNRYCVEAAVKTALAFGCKINKKSSFDRKHYFYADMPSGYQITQYRHPLAIGGELDYVIYVRGRHKKARICKARLQQIQLEQDSGKSLHDSEGRQSLVDLNRAGVALMEIVTEPDFEDGEQAAAFVRDIQASLKLINTCDGKMEQGSLRIDANISVHKPGSPYGVRTEVKNLNSVKSVEQAIDYEVKRQKNLLARGGQVINQTMSFDCDTRQTVAMRDKERLQDYRFMAEPNLPPIVLTDGSTDNPHILSIDHIRAGMPELLPALRQRLISYGLSLEQAMTTIELRLVNIFEEMLKLSSNPTVSSQSAFRFLNLVVVRACSEQKCSLEHLLSVVTLEKLSHLWHAYEKEALTHISSTELLHRLLNEPAATVQALLESGEFTRISDEREILRYCVAVAENNPKLARRYQKKKGSREFAELISIIQKDSENRIDHVDLFRVLRAYLDSKPSSSNS